MKIDIYNHKRKAELALKRLDASEICVRNKEAIHRFVDSLIADGISMARITRYIDAMRFWAIWLNKDFDEVTKQDISERVTKLQMDNHYGVWSKKTYMVMIKRFYKWLCGKEEYPPEVSWIKARIRLCDKKLPGSGEIITEEEICKILDVITLPRDKALISMLWESGCRISEILTLILSNIEIDKFGILITVEGKTGSRRIRLVSSTPYVMVWLNMHPYWNKNKTRPLWFSVSNHNRNVRMSYSAVNKLLRKYFEQAGIPKRCNPHMLRHSRATYLANRLTEFQMNQYFGWRQGSDMPSTYVHMSGKEIDSAILSMHGIVNDDAKKQEVQLSPKRCPRCDTFNTHDSLYCCKCAGVLDIQEMLRLEDEHQKESLAHAQTDELLARMAKDPEVIRYLVQKLQKNEIINAN